MSGWMDEWVWMDRLVDGCINSTWILVIVMLLWLLLP